MEVLLQVVRDAETLVLRVCVIDLWVEVLALRVSRMDEAVRSKV